MVEDDSNLHMKIKVDTLEVVRHFLKTQWHKPELRKYKPEIKIHPVQVLLKVYPPIGAAICEHTWYLCTIHQGLFRSLKAIPAQRWLDLSNGSQKIVDIANTIKTGPLDKEEKRTKSKILRLVKALSQDSLDRRIIIARKYIDCDYILLDGNSRAAAMAYSIQFLQGTFDPFDAYLGY